MEITEAVMPAKARHQPVITPAPADRTEPHRSAFFVLGVEQEFYFVDRPGILDHPLELVIGRRAAPTRWRMMRSVRMARLVCVSG